MIIDKTPIPYYETVPTEYTGLVIMCGAQGYDGSKYTTKLIKALDNGCYVVNKQEIKKQVIYESDL